MRNNNPFLYKDPDNPYAVKEVVLPVGGIYERDDRKMYSYDFRLTATYNTTIKNAHIINLFAGMEVNSADRHNTWFRGWGLQYDMGMTPFYDYRIFKKGQEEGSKYYTLGDTYYRNNAYYFNGTYSYKGRYTVNGTFRYEGTNKLGKSRKSRWLPTWNISGAWNLHEESWFQKAQPALSHLSLKASYSLTADRGPSTVTNSRVVINAYTPWRPSAGDGESGLKIEDLENSSLTYEKKHELNIGADMGFANNRINLVVDWYKRNNFDLIGDVTTQGIGGIIKKKGNVAEMKSNGIEISLSTKNIKTKNFSWTTDFIYSHIHNEVSKLETSVRVMDLVAGSGFTLEGYPVRSLFSIPFMGLNEIGLPTFLDQNGDVSTTGINFQERENLSFLQYSGSVDPTDHGVVRQRLPVERAQAERLHHLLVRQRGAPQPRIQVLLFGSHGYAARIQEPLDGNGRRKENKHPDDPFPAHVPRQQQPVARLQRLQLFDGSHRQRRLHPHEGDIADLRFPEKADLEAEVPEPLRKISGDQPLPDLRGQETQRPGSGVLQHRRCRGTGSPPVHADHPHRLIVPNTSKRTTR